MSTVGYKRNRSSFHVGGTALDATCTSGGWAVGKHPQYVEETTFGVTPTNPAMQWIGAVASWEPRVTINPIEIRELAMEDVAFWGKGQEAYSIALEYYPQDTTFAKYAVNAQGTTPSIDKSLSIISSIKAGNESDKEYFYMMQGCKADTTDITCTVNEPVRITTTFTCRDIPIPLRNVGATIIGSGSWATDPGIEPYLFTTGSADGTSPVTIEGNKVPCRTITVSIARNLESMYVLGDTRLKCLVPKQRGVTGTIDLVWVNQDHYVDLKEWNDCSVVWTLKAGTMLPSDAKTLTLTGAKFSALSGFRLTPTDAIVESYTISGKSLVLS